MVESNTYQSFFEGNERRYCKMAVRLVYWAAFFLNRDNRAQSELYCQLAETTLKKIRIPSLPTVKAYNILGIQYFSFGLYDKAERIFQLEKTIIEKIGLQNEFCHVQCLNNLGAVSVKLKNYDIAKDFFMQSSALMKKIAGHQKSLK